MPFSDKARPGQSELGRSPLLRNAALLQEDSPVEFDPVTLPPPSEFLMLMSGNPAASFVSNIVWPDTGMRSRRDPLDPKWILFHEALSFPCWYFLGSWIDTGRRRLGFTFMAYLVIRAAMAVAGIYEFGWRIQVVFWWSLTLWLLAFGITRLCRLGWSYARRA